MAIYTRRGNPCEIIDVIAGSLVRVRLVYGGGTFILDTSDLRADGGQVEIDAALTHITGVYGNEERRDPACHTSVGRRCVG